MAISPHPSAGPHPPDGMNSVVGAGDLASGLFVRWTSRLAMIPPRDSSGWGDATTRLGVFHSSCSTKRRIDMEGKL